MEPENLNKLDKKSASTFENCKTVEDIEDIAAFKSRSTEPCLSFESVLKKLKKEGKL